MLVVFPLGLLGTAPVFDIVGLTTGHSFWFRCSFWMIAAGLIGGLAAALFGVVDWLAIPEHTRGKSVGTRHGLVNGATVLLFAASWILRRPSVESPTIVALTLSFFGLALSICGAWLGGELVDRLGVGVDDGAHLNSPSSLLESSINRH